MSDEAALNGKPVSNTNQRIESAGLPPSKREPTALLRLLNDFEIGLPTETAKAEPYHAGLSLDAVGQPYVSAGVDRFGALVGGGLAFAWSDMLGNHNLYASINADTYGTGFSDLAKNTGGVLAYTNLRHRWNWGASIEQTPYVAGGYAAGIDRASNTYLDQTIIQREVYRGFSGMTAYPFTPSNRVEFGAGFSQITWD